jgi:hypothetical protein
VFVDEIEDCIVALIEVPPSDLFVEYGNRFDESMMCEIYDMVQERIRHKCLSREHERLVLGQFSP